MKNKTLILILAALAILAFMRFRPILSIGTCLNSSGDGHLDASTETLHEPYTYISYRGIAEAGERVITLDVFNPFNNACDDTILVMDYNIVTNRISVRHTPQIIIEEG